MLRLNVTFSDKFIWTWTPYFKSMIFGLQMHYHHCIPNSCQFYTYSRTSLSRSRRDYAKMFETGNTSSFVHDCFCIYIMCCACTCTCTSLYTILRNVMRFISEIICMFCMLYIMYEILNGTEWFSEMCSTILR